MRTKDMLKIASAYKAMYEQKDPNEYDQEGSMLKTQLRKIDSATDSLMAMVKDDANLPEWVQSKMALATDYIRSVRDYLEAENVNEEIQGKQLVHHDETTKNFDICPSALKAFNDNQEDGMGDKEGFHDAVVAVDKYLGIEKDLTEKGSATQEDMDMMKAAVEDAKAKIDAAGLPGHDYHEIHITAVEQLMDNGDA